MTPHTTRSRLAKLVLASFAGAWLAIVAIPPVVFMGWREARLAEMSAPAAQADWDQFRADMREQSGESGPVRRKVPRSVEPPERVWLRDFPLTVVAAWVVFVGLLGAVIGVLLRGALRSPTATLPGISGPGSAGP